MIKWMKNNFVLSALGALLLYAGWPPSPIPITLFFAFIPWLIIKKRMADADKSSFRFATVMLPGLLLFNIATTWWVIIASIEGAVAMLLFNTLLMGIPWMLSFKMQKRYGEARSQWWIVIFWLGMEYFHHHWDGNWPWLTLGNGLANAPKWVQFYEFTGTAGGSLWILCANMAFYYFIIKPEKVKIWKPAAILFVPFLISMAILASAGQKYKTDGVEVVVVQPSFNPYTEKYNRNPALSIPPNEQLEQAIKLAEKTMTPNTKLVVFPETMLVGNFNESYARNESMIIRLQVFSKEHNNVAVVAGAETYELIYSKGRPVVAANLVDSNGVWSVYYNTAYIVDSTGPSKPYHKSLLVPGPEGKPFGELMDFLGVDFGNAMGGLGSSKEPEVFNGGNNIKVGPIICYESVFGDYIRKYINKDANLLAIITNDAWWDNTDGHKQHLLYGALRTIETRRFMVRSANTGISAIIDPLGNIVQSSDWYEKKAIKANVHLLTGKTFFVSYGDIIGYFTLWLTIIALSVLFIIWCHDWVVRPRKNMRQM